MGVQAVATDENVVRMPAHLAPSDKRAGEGQCLLEVTLADVRLDPHEELDGGVSSPHSSQRVVYKSRSFSSTSAAMASPSRSRRRRRRAARARAQRASATSDWCRSR